MTDMAFQLSVAIAKVLWESGRLPMNRRVIVTDIKTALNGGIDATAWAPGYPAEFKQCYSETVEWTVTFLEVQAT